MKEIAIIGAGFSGTMCAVHLLKNAKSPMKIYLIDKDQPGRGVAYARNDLCFLLNVRADQMGAFPEAPAHFFEWLKKKNIPAAPTDLLPRSTYGDYIQSVLDEAGKSGTAADLEIIQDTVLDIDEKNHSLLLQKRSPLKVDNIVLASGLEAKVATHLDQFKNSRESLTIIGTGLSMIDTLVYLEKINYEGKITAVSRHGRIPSSHQFYSPEVPRPVYDFSKDHSLRFVLKTIKDNLKKFEWRLVIDALRPHNQFLWSHFTIREKGQFYRYCRSLWDVHRHRMSPDHKIIVEKLIAEGKLQIKAIGYKNYRPQTDHTIELTGLSFGSDAGNELIKNLLSKNIIQKDVFNLGIKADPQGHVYQNWIYTLGPMRRGQLWECTAVPEIRVQARDLALHLIESN